MKEILTFFLLLITGILSASNLKNKPGTKTLIPFRLLWPNNISEIVYTDLDGDKDPDVLSYFIRDSIGVLWIDDDDDMSANAITGDLDSDCVLIDLNKDGQYGGPSDLIVDWNDEDGDGIADMQVVLENGLVDYRGKWKSHFMYIINTDNKGIFNYIDWNTFKVEGWEKAGRCNFMTNYHGNSLMLKVHISSFDIKDIRYNWENPFLFFDEDEDGYSEIAFRLVDEPVKRKVGKDDYAFEFSEHISLAQLTFDLDNDNGSSNEIDYDLSLKFSGKGFNYSDQVNNFSSMKGLDGTEKYFYDARFRQQTELIYCNHDSAYNMIYERGEWESCWLVFDEDDDCHRWERVEFYDPMDPARFGPHNGGLDDNPQTEVSGDRGEWDKDFSGQGTLYISPFDNKIHLLGAETGYWRIDQFAHFYQGWQGWRGPNIQPEDHVCIEPDSAPFIKYTDTDNNGFFDLFEFDMDADGVCEENVSLFDLDLPDMVDVYPTKDMEYRDFQKLFETAAQKNWQTAQQAFQTAKKFGIETSWYSFLLKANSIQEKYNNGFWLSWYLYNDMVEFCKLNKKDRVLKQVHKSYFGSNWAYFLD